ncbi:TrmH family RNA methyltransferase [Streptococcus dentiloxodontae]
MEIIQSKANSAVKSAKKLLQKKYRKSSYLIEGWHLYQEAKANGAEILRVFVLADMADRIGNEKQIKLVTPEVLREISDTPSPQGIVAEIALRDQIIPERLSGKYLVLEDVQDPGNVGTMIRTADAAGFTGVFLSDKSADIYNQKTLRSMQGSQYHLPVYRGNIWSFIQTCQTQGISVLATSLSENSTDYKSLGNQESFALVMGNEGQGISEQMEQEADQLVHITMSGQAESLNVAVAAGILMFSL